MTRWEDAAAGRATVDFLDLRFAHCDMAGALEWVFGFRQHSGFAYIVTPNVDHVVRLHRARGDADGDLLWRAYREADLCLCDSRILSLLARRSQIDLPVVAGSDLTAHLLSTPLPEGTRIALIGGNQAQCDWLKTHLPTAEICQHQPPMGLRTNRAAQEEAARFVEQVEPHMTLFTVGAPQSELVAHLLKSRGKAQGVALCIGASIEFLTGEKRRAPRFMQAMNMEWAFRLISEPRRLWRRYLMEGPAIVSIWLRWDRHKAQA